MNMFWQTVISADFLFSIIRVTTPILLCALGSVIASSSGICNISLDGCMILAAFGGVYISALTQSVFLGIAGAIFFGSIFSLLFAFSVITLKVNDVIAGIALNLMAGGSAVFMLFLAVGEKGISSKLDSMVIPSIEIPLINQIPVIGKILSGHNMMTYIAFIMVLVVSVFLKYTRTGIKIRAIGEDEDTARSVGVKVVKYRYIAILLSGILASMGGAYLSMGYMRMFTSGMVAGRGYIAIAAEAMGNATPAGALAATLIFGIFDALSNVMQSFRIPSELIQCVPYVATMAGFIIISMRKNRQKDKSKLKGK